MATLEQVIEGLIAFRDETYSRLNSISDKIDNLELINYRICTMCHGSGLVTPSHNIQNGTPEPIQCPNCSGEGKVFSGESIEKT